MYAYVYACMSVYLFIAHFIRRISGYVDDDDDDVVDNHSDIDNIRKRLISAFLQ